MENECVPLTELVVRRWIITNYSELKEHVLSQCKEIQNLEKMLDEMLTRITSLEKSINDVMELKNTAQELQMHTQASVAEQIKQKKGYHRLKIKSMK